MLGRPGTDVDGIVVGMSLSGKASVVARGTWPDGASVSARSMFYAASLTKQLIGLFAAMSVELGELAAEDSLRRWLPSLPPWTSAVTVDQLLHHTAGFPLHIQPDCEPHTTISVLEAMERLDSPVAPPGSRFEYSNDGYVLLALVLERATGIAIEQLAEQRVFASLGTHSSSLRRAPVVDVANEPTPPSTIGDGGWWTNISDLMTFLEALNAGTFDPAAFRLMERGKLTGGDSIDYAWGVRSIAIEGFLPPPTAAHGSGDNPRRSVYQP